MACEQNFVECVAILVENGASLEKQDSRGFTPCAYSAWVGNLAMAKQLRTQVDEFVVPKVIKVRLDQTVEKEEELQSSQGTYSPNLPSLTLQTERSNENSEDNSNGKMQANSNGKMKDNSNGRLQSLSQEAKKLHRRVQFRVKSSYPIVGKYIAVVGNRTVLGRWDETQAVPMTKLVLEDNEQETWAVTLNLPTLSPIKYKYLLCTGDVCLKSEGQRRTFTVNPADTLYTREDGMFGTIPEAEHKTTIVQDSCLKHGYQLRLVFGARPDTLPFLPDALNPIEVFVQTKEPVTSQQKAIFPCQTPQVNSSSIFRNDFFVFQQTF